MPVAPKRIGGVSMQAHNTSSRQSGVSQRPALRQCPTIAGKSATLITHSIEGGLCQKRQREHYHKCHRCVYRGKPVDFSLDEDVASRLPVENGVARNGHTTGPSVPPLGGQL